MTEVASLSVITPSYMYERFLTTCLRSVRDQHRESGAWEVQHVVVDDGSTDGSWDVIRRELPPADIVVQENRGLSRTLNRALDMATGDVVCWLNADDFHLPWTYAVVERAFREHPEAALVVGDTVFVDDLSRMTRLAPQPPFDARVQQAGYNMLHVPSAFWRRSALPHGWQFDPGMLLYMDMDLWFALTAGGGPVVSLDAPLSAFRRHPQQVSASVRDTDEAEVATLAERYSLSSLRPHPRAAHVRHAALKVRSGAALRELRARRLAGTLIDWTRGASIPDGLRPARVRTDLRPGRARS